MSRAYIDDIAREIYLETLGAGESTELSPGYLGLYRIYAVLSRALAGHCTSEDVHDAWVAWQLDSDPHHRSIKLFADLAPEVQRLDDKYRDAINRVAVKRFKKATARGEGGEDGCG